MTEPYDPAADPVHGSGWNSAAQWGGWSWREPRYGDHFRTCSFCGCIHPEDLVTEKAGTGCGFPSCPEPHNELARCHFPPPSPLPAENGEHRFADTGWRASWADRKYGWPHKFYIEGIRPRDPDLSHCISSSSGSDDPRERWPGSMGLQWHRVSECPPELIEAAKAGGMAHSAENEDGWLGFGPRATLHAKFYTIHLADPAISAEVKETIERVAGLHFEFADGRVQWERWREPPASGS